MSPLFLLMALAAAQLQHLLGRARGGSGRAWKALVAALLPVVRARVAREVGRGRQQQRLRPLLDMQEDVEQQVFLVLFRDDARALDDWDPERGMSLENYVGMIAQREASNAVRYWRSESRRPEVLAEGDEPLEAGPAETGADAVDAEARHRDREQLDRLWRRLEVALTPKGLLMFRLLFVEELDADEVAQVTGQAKRSVYNWKNLLKQMVRDVTADWSSPAVG